MPKVSIIVPCFNQSKYISETLDSILLQTYSNWECIIIDDGSIDNTKSVAMKYVAKDGRIQYIYQENQGVCLARNHAIALSGGDYILCLDGDDKISDNFVSVSVSCLEKNKDCKVVTSNIQLFGRKKTLIHPPVYSLELLLARNLFVMTSLFRKSDFDRTSGFNNNMKKGFEDWDFWISLLETGGQVIYNDNIVFYYRMHGKTSRNHSINQKTFKILRKQIYENHRATYANHFIDPMETFEYKLLSDSKEYKVGKALLKYIRTLMR